MFTARMKYLVAVVLDRHVDGVTKELLSLGLLHFVKVQELQAGLETKVKSVALDVSSARLLEIRKRIESFLGMIEYYPETQKRVALAHLAPVDLDASEKTLNAVAGEVQGFRDRQKAIQQEILKLEDVKRQVQLFGDMNASFRSGSQYTFLSFRIGLVESPRTEELRAEIDALPSVMLSYGEEAGRTSLLIVTMKRDDAQVDSILRHYDFQEMEVIPEMTGVKEDVTGGLEKKLAALAAEQETLGARSRTVIEDHRHTLIDLWENLKLNELYYRIQSYFSRTARTMLFSGWVPASRRAAIEQGVRRATGGSCYLEWRDPEGLEKETRRRVSVPVLLRNLKFLSPFQMLVTNYSIPQYKTVDPTPIVAVLYLIMFGLMFGDVGQGLVIMALGVIGTLFGKFKKNMKEIVRLLIFCGGAAVVCGFLFGSFFGLDGVVPAVWFDFHKLVNAEEGAVMPAGSPVTSIVQVLLITLYFGIVVIVIGLILNWINLVRTRQWFLLIFDRRGLVGSWLYFGGVYVIYRFALTDFKALPPGTEMIFAVGIPALLLFGLPIAEFVAHKAEHPEKRFTVVTPIGMFFSWLLELLEFFTGFLSNTLSFMRVAGLGIAHVALMYAFFQINTMLAKGGLPAVGVAVFVLGNIFVIALEGLSAGIQALRLNYYEFFSKYFKGSGERYLPVSLKG